jgi:hypothetical protein
MDDARLRCAETALRQVPEDYRTVEAADVAGQERGQGFHQGMHIGWAWGQDERGRPYLDFLSEHRHPGMRAERYFITAERHRSQLPPLCEQCRRIPAKTPRSSGSFSRAIELLRGSAGPRPLPAEGENVGSQDIHEYLLKGAAPTGRSDPVPTSAGGAQAVRLGGGWDEVLRDELDEPYWSKLLEFITYEHANHDVYPPRVQTFKAFELTPYDDVKVVILGQDPLPQP